jgi:hypothetical protein
VKHERVAEDVEHESRWGHMAMRKALGEEAFEERVACLPVLLHRGSQRKMGQGVLKSTPSLSKLWRWGGERRGGRGGS